MASNLQKLIGIYLRQVQDAEDALEGLMSRSGMAGDLQLMEGSQLDSIGSIVGEARRSSGDSEYRLRIIARIAVNSSRGTMEDIIDTVRNFTRALTGTSRILQARESFPASVIVDAGFVSSDFYVDQDVGLAVGDAAAGGVAVFFFFDTSLTPFQFGDSTGAIVPPVDTGFGGMPLTSQGSGGELSGLVI